ncbi:hypothetical protein F8S13_18355 [Chloroflexia bacterium SDU3-3]|nr:hypothetical protein F8S13_18355 [Chloroflexia bacterium SDU3-3]
MTTDIDLGAHTSPAALAQALDHARRQIIQGAAGDPDALLAALPLLWRYALLRGALTTADGQTMNAAQQAWRGIAIAYEITKILAKGHHYNQALALAQRIPDGHHTWAMRGIAAAMAENGDVEQAVDLADSICNERQRADVQVEIARALSKAQRWDEAAALARAAGRYLDDIACDLAEAGRHAEALALLRTSGNGDEHNWAMSQIAVSLARAGRGR